MMIAQWLCAASAVAVVLFAARLITLARRLDALSAAEQDARRAAILRTVRWSGLAAKLVQACLFFAMLIAAHSLSKGWRFFPIPWYLFVALLQGQLQFRVEKRVRRTEATAFEHFRFAARFTAVSLLQTAALMAASGGLCWAWSKELARLGLADGHPVLLWSGVGVIVLFVLTVFYAASPWLVRLMIPCEPVEDPELKARLASCFSRAGLKVPRPYLMKLDRYGTHNAMIVGLRTALDWPPSAVIVSRGLVEKLSPEEFEAVILHEASHVALRHVTKRLLMTFAAIALSVGITTLWDPLLRPFLPAPGVLPLVDFFAIIGTQLLLIRWQVRFQELEADSHAVIALGASPGALIGGIARTMRLNDLQTSENDPNALINAGAAHPTVAARAAELNRRIHAAKDGRPLDLRWEPYRALRGTGGTAVIACAALLLSALAWGWTAKILPARALRIAAQTGDLDRLSALRPTANLDASDPLTLYTPLTAALSTGCFSGARWLVEHGADAGRADARGITPIIMASVRGDADAVRLLVAHGADPRTPNMKGFNPAAIAAMRGDVALFEALKDAGVDLNAPAWKGRPPLALTDHMKKTAASSWLRAHGAREPEPERP